MTPIATSSSVQAVAERGEEQRERDRRGEEADAQVDAGERGREHAGERDVAQRVAGEDLRAQHDEVADGAAGERDRRAGEERVADELVRQHQRARAAAPSAAT